LGFEIDLPKIHDNIDVVQVANEIKLCGVKIFSSTITIFGLNWTIHEKKF